MYTPLDMRKLQDRLDAINNKVEETKVEEVKPEEAPKVEEVELAHPEVPSNEYNSTGLPLVGIVPSSVPDELYIANAPLFATAQ